MSNVAAGPGARPDKKSQPNPATPRPGKKTSAGNIAWPQNGSPLIRLFSQLQPLPGGKWLFSKIVALKAPYFRSIDPQLVTLRPGYSEWRLKKRWRVTNHLGTVHALAMGNLAEMCAGTCAEASLGKGLRWIPKTMTVEYLAKATSDLYGICEIDPASLKPGDNVLPVEVFNTQGDKVFRADITMYVSAKKAE